MKPALPAGYFSGRERSVPRQIGSLLPCAGRAGTGRPRPASAGRKTVAARTLAALAVAASRDALGRQMPGALMRRWSRGIYADHRDRTRRGNRRAGFPAPMSFAGTRRSETPPCVARSRRARPPSTGTAREGSASSFDVCSQICSRARAAVRAGQRERAGLDQVKRACSVMAALGWGPSAGRERQAEGAFFPVRVSCAGANCCPGDLRDLGAHVDG